MRANQIVLRGFARQDSNLGFYPRAATCSGSWTDFGFCRDAAIGGFVEVQKQEV
jgi:hypothetical protein